MTKENTDQKAYKSYDDLLQQHLHEMLEPLNGSVWGIIIGILVFLMY